MQRLTNYPLVNTLSNHRTVEWVTRPDCPKGAKDEVKGRLLKVGAHRAPKLLVYDNVLLAILFLSFAEPPSSGRKSNTELICEQQPAKQKG